MDFIYEKDRIMPSGDSGAILTEVSFLDVGTGTVNIDHIFVDDSLRGQGAAGKLTETAAKQPRETDKKAVLTCLYTVKWFEKHPEYSPVVEGRSPDINPMSLFKNRFFFDIQTAAPFSRP